MTVSVQQPYIVYTGNGVLVDYTFTFGLVEEVDLQVLVDGALLVESTGYTLAPIPGYPKGNSFWNGGTVTFTTAPADASSVVILRKTTITQQLDYEAGNPFPVESHEEGFDKFTYILQELRRGIWGGIDGDGEPILLTFDLGVVAEESTMLVTNTGGSDARLPAWVSATTAGVFHGEITTSAPLDEAVTTKADGYVFIEVAT